MTNNIGPTFAKELQAAGLTGLPFSWGDDGTFAYDESMTSDQIAAVQAVFAAHVPTKGLYAAAARAALDDSDITMHRLTEAVALGLTTFTAVDAAAFVTYRRTLRQISDGTLDEALPVKPSFPVGT
jgi:hypothetical protein